MIIPKRMSGASKPFSANNSTGVRIPSPLLFLVAILVRLGMHQFMFHIQSVLYWFRDALHA